MSEAPVTDSPPINVNSETYSIESSLPVELASDRDALVNYLNLDPKAIKVATAKLPLIYKENRGYLPGKGVVWIEGDAAEDRSVYLSFSMSYYLHGQDPEAISVRTEELVHAFHFALNDKEVDQIIETRRLVDRYRWVSDAPAIVEGAQLNANRELTRFCARSNLELPTPPTDHDELESAIMYSLGISPEPNANPNDEVPELSVGELARINTALENRGLVETDDYVSHELSRYEHILSGYGAKRSTGENLYDDKKFLFEEEKHITHRLKRRIKDYLGTSPGRPSEEVIRNVSQAFIDANVPLDRIGHRTSQIERQIQTLSPDRVKDALLTYLKDPCTKLELLIVARGTDFPELFKLQLALEKALNENVEQASLLISDTQNKLVEHVGALPSDSPILASEGRYALQSLMRTTQRIAASESTIEKELFWFADDLPSDPEARKKLLQNPQFVLAYQNAVLQALRDPSVSPFGEIEINPRQIAGNDLAAIQTTRESLKGAMKNPEMAALISDINSQADFQRNTTIADDTAKLERYASDEVDIALVESGVSLSNIVDESSLIDAQARAHQLSMERIGALQQEKLESHRRQILLEPIAKVVAAQRAGQQIADVTFPQGFMASYSQLLRTDDFKDWVTKLWGFVKESRESGNGKAILEFMRATSLEQQAAVLDGFNRTPKSSLI